MTRRDHAVGDARGPGVSRRSGRRCPRSHAAASIGRPPGGWTSISSSAPSAVPYSSRPSWAASAPCGGARRPPRAAARCARRAGRRRAARARCRRGGSARARGARAPRRAAAGSSRRSSAVIFGASVMPSDGCSRAVGPLVERLHEQLAADVGEPPRQRRRSRRRAGSRPPRSRQTGPASISATGRMMQTPVFSSPASIAALDRRGAAPARQQRGVDVQHRVLGQERLLDQRAERADHAPRPASRRRSARAPRRS